MIMIGYEIATGNGSIVCQCVWSRTSVIGTIGKSWQHFCVVVLSRSPNIEMSHSVGEKKCRSRNASFLDQTVIYNGAKSVTYNSVTEGGFA